MQSNARPLLLPLRAPLCLPAKQAPGRYKISVRGQQLGAEGGLADIRGSPFTVECSDPWQQQPLAGAAPAKRAGATLSSLGGDLLG